MQWWLFFFILISNQATFTGIESQYILVALTLFLDKINFFVTFVNSKVMSNLIDAEIIY